MNLIAAAFVMMGTFFDAGVWYYVKDLKIFDEEVKDSEWQKADQEDEGTFEKP
jgi:organic anion transporter 5A